MRLYSFLRPFVFLLPPETAHHATCLGLRLLGSTPPSRRLLALFGGAPASDPVTLFGLTFPNRVGLAAGYDKDARAWRGLAALGFGHLELGTVTPAAQPGNPRPRVFRLPAERSLINRLGFPSQGADAVAARLPPRGAAGPVIGVNLGKNKATPVERAADDYLALVERFAPLADYLTVNVSSPNTPGLRRLQDAGSLRSLLSALVARRDAMGGVHGRVPLLVKLSPDLTAEALEEAVDIIAASGVDGVVATNTTRDRTGVPARLADREGGLSGALLADRASRVVERITTRLQGRLPVVAAGGIMDGAAARRRLDAGASLVQLYTGLVYRGPGLVGEVVAATGTRAAARVNPGGARS